MIKLLHDAKIYVLAEFYLCRINAIVETKLNGKRAIFDTVVFMRIHTIKGNADIMICTNLFGKI